MGFHFLLQRIFLTQGSNPGLPHCGQTLDRLSHLSEIKIVLAMNGVDVYTAIQIYLKPLNFTLNNGLNRKSYVYFTATFLMKRKLNTGYKKLIYSSGAGFLLRRSAKCFAVIY